MKKLTLLLLTLIVLSGCSSNEEKLIVLTSSGYYPYEMVDESGKLIGFDIEFGEALAAQMNVEIEWQDMDFDGIIASLNSGRGDMALAAISPDPARNALFSQSYYVGDEESPFFVLALKDSNITSTQDIEGKRSEERRVGKECRCK